MTILAADNTVTDASLERLQALMDIWGISYQQTDFGLRCERKAFGATYATFYFAPLAAIYSEGQALSDAKEVFRQCQEEWLGEDYYNRRPNGDMYLFLIADKGTLRRAMNAGVVATVEDNRSFARKVVAPPESMKHWLVNPYGALDTAALAGREPMLALLKELDEESRSDESLLVFNSRTVLQNLDVARLMGDASLRERVDTTFRRVMGLEYQVIWNEDGPRIGFVDSPGGTPLAYCSSGETLAFAFSVFMGTAKTEMASFRGIAIHASLNQLDPLRELAAFDCIRDFALATGASIRFQSARSNSQALFERKLGPIMEGLKRVARD